MHNPLKMRSQNKKSRRHIAERNQQNAAQSSHLGHYRSLNDLQPTVRRALQQPSEVKSNSFHEARVEHNESYQSLPSVIAAELSVSSSTSNNNSVSPTVRNVSPSLRRNLSLGALHHQYPNPQSKGSFVSATTFSAPISPKYLDKLPPIHKNIKKRHHPPLSSNPKAPGLSPFHDALSVNNRCRKICENQESDGSFDRMHPKRPPPSKSKPLRSRKRNAPKARNVGFKRIHSMPSLQIDLSRLSIEENSTKMHSLSAAPKSARPAMSILDAEGIKNDIALQFDLAPKSIDQRSSFDITADGAFEQNGFTVSRDGLRIDGGGDRRARRYDVTPSDLVAVSILGRGSSSVVYKSWDLQRHRFVALKCVSALEQDKRRQIHNELALLTDNSCPDIVAFYGSYFDSGQITFCLQFFDVGSLQELIELNGRIPPRVISFVVAPILRAVDFLHSRKRTIYRDIKPSNILIHSNGTVKLSDFGIVHRLCDGDGDGDAEVGCNEVIGTTIYMAPQRLSGKQYSFPSDVWSIGLCVAQSVHPQFALFTEHSQCTQLVHKFVLTATRPIHHFFPDDVAIDEAAAHFMERCLCRKEADRSTAEQLLQHRFIAAAQNAMRPREFAEYVRASDAGRAKRDKADKELLSIQQSLSQMAKRKEISREAMQRAVDEIRSAMDDTAAAAADGEPVGVEVDE